MDENVEWEKKESTQGDPRYWRHRQYLDLQVDGVYDGYMMANKDKPERVRIEMNMSTFSNKPLLLGNQQMASSVCQL